ncbi:MAG: hypothetical protein HY518_04825 [Candidatus Aenigmarchaeota archaeon]|nr:hypothetical protein [Candidatus Aenigmarchaeota archaeon]
MNEPGLYVKGRRPPQNKWELRDYLKGLDLHDAGLLKSKAAEIMGNVRRVMKRYVEYPPGDTLGDYYRPAVKKLEDAYGHRDFEKEFPAAVSFMIDSVELE